MKIAKSYLRAGALLAIIIAWFVYNAVKAEDKPAPVTSAPERTEIIPTVVVEARTASKHTNILSLYGRTEAARTTTVKAETAGRLVRTPAREGAVVKAGQLVCAQDIDARQAMLDQARANYRSVEVDLSAARTLAEKGYQSATRVTAIEAQMDGARASIKRAEIELDNVNMRAPFSGIWERQLAESGDYLSPGQPCGLLVELSPLIVTSELTEIQVGLIKAGQEASIELATGERVTGKVRLIESTANPATRTFRTEVAVPNADMKLKAGVTATVNISAGTTMAQHIPSKILALNDDGTVGVRHLGFDNVVRFSVVQTIDEDDTGIWVTGLPESTRIITKGQDYVAIGSTVEPTLADTKTTNAMSQ